MIRRRTGSGELRQPPRGCLAVLLVILGVAGVHGLWTGHFTWFFKRHGHIDLYGTAAVVGSIGYLLWATACLLMVLPEFHWRKPIAWAALVGGLVLHFAAPFTR